MDTAEIYLSCNALIRISFDLFSLYFQVILMHIIHFSLHRARRIILLEDFVLAYKNKQILGCGLEIKR
jgi:hypothetical protein